MEPAHRLEATERREQLIQVAIDLFSQKGFNGATTRAIAAAAGVTEAIIFRHFETKQHLYLAIIDRKFNQEKMAEWVLALKALMDRNDDEAVIRTLIEAILLMNKEDPKFERLMLYAALEGHEIAKLYIQRISASVVDVFRHYFLRRQQEGALSPVGPDVAFIAVVGMAQHFAQCKYLHSLEEPLVPDVEAVDSFTQIAMQGLCVRTKRKGTAK